MSACCALCAGLSWSVAWRLPHGARHTILIVVEVRRILSAAVCLETRWRGANRKTFLSPSNRPAILCVSW